MQRKKQVFSILLGIDFSLMLVATILLYILLPRPFYYWTESGLSFTAVDTLGKDLWWLMVPAAACLLLLVSVRYNWISLIAGGLPIAFGTVLYLVPSVAMATESMVTKAPAVKLDACPAEGWIGWLITLTSLLCLARFVMGMVQHIFHVNAFSFRRRRE